MARLIDADELLKKAEYIPTGLKSRGMQVGFHGVTAAVIENAPTIDPESLRPSGRWDDAGYVVWCSNCGEPYLPAYKSYKYCPNCGAKMEDTNEN